MSSVLRRVLRPALRRPPRRAFNVLQASTSASAAVDASPLSLLEHSITERRPTQALTYLTQLETPPSTQLLQKLALLLARQKTNRSYALRAFEILRGVYRLPGLTPDDYTKLASIYVMDACLRFRMLDQAMELYDEAVNQAVVLDLPAYDALLKALLRAKRLEEATEILREISAGEDVIPTENTFLPVLMELVIAREYMHATELMKQGISRGVEFTSETFHPLLTLAERDSESTDSLIGFLSFIEESWEEYRTFDDFGGDDVDEDDPENPLRSP